MPLSIEQVLITYTGDNKPLFDVAAMAKQEVILCVEKEMASRGFAIAKARLEEADLAKEPELRFEVTQIQANFQRRIDEISRAKRGEELHFSLGSEVSYFADRADANALIFVAIKGYQKSTEEMSHATSQASIIGALTGVYRSPSSTQAQIQVALVDAVTGEVWWYSVEKGDYYLGSRVSVVELVKKVFSNFPADANFAK